MEHYYQPGFIFVPFDIYQPEETVKPIAEFIPDGVTLLRQRVERIDAAASQPPVRRRRATLPYDLLIIATGCKIAPEETEGMAGTGVAARSVLDFYTLRGCRSPCATALRTWQGGRLLVHITEMPIKCPVAPLEFAFLADWYFRLRRHARPGRAHLRHAAQRSLHPKPRAAATLDHLLDGEARAARGGLRHRAGGQRSAR